MLSYYAPGGEGGMDFHNEMPSTAHIEHALLSENQLFTSLHKYCNSVHLNIWCQSENTLPKYLMCQEKTV